MLYDTPAGLGVVGLRTDSAENSPAARLGSLHSTAPSPLGAPGASITVSVAPATVARKKKSKSDIIATVAERAYWRDFIVRRNHTPGTGSNRRRVRRRRAYGGRL